MYLYLDDCYQSTKITPSFPHTNLRQRVCSAESHPLCRLGSTALTLWTWPPGDHSLNQTPGLLWSPSCWHHSGSLWILPPHGLGPLELSVQVQIISLCKCAIGLNIHINVMYLTIVCSSHPCTQVLAKASSMCMIGCYISQSEDWIWSVAQRHHLHFNL